jgi:hypothetical protein
MWRRKIQMTGRKKTDPKVGFFFTEKNYLVVAGAEAAAAGAEASAAGAAAGAEASAAGVTAGADAAAGAATSAAGAGAGAASSFLLHATKAIANRDTIKRDFFICELSV